MNGSLPSGLDAYAMEHLLAHMYSAGPEYFPKLFDLAVSRDWFNAHGAFDPTRKTYVDGLEWGLRALNERILEGDSDLLGRMVVVSLLRTTVTSLSQNIPPSALDSAWTASRERPLQRWSGRP